MEEITDFAALGLTGMTLDALQKKGFSIPTPIQALTIPKLLAGSRNLIGQARTGTGKTAAFALPILEKITADGSPRALILAPTRELGIQIAEEIHSLLGERKLHAAAFYGGQPIELQIRELRNGMELVIGTPGRILDLLKRGVLQLDQLRFAVLDEADEMLDMGFIDDIREILSHTNTDKQTLMFSATMPDPILAIAEEFMPDYEIVRAESRTEPTKLAEQCCYEVRREDKFAALTRIIAMEPDIYALIFCRTRTDVDDLAEKLKIRGLHAEALHGEIPQTIRLRLINQFKEKKFNLLVATDVAARGIDVNDLTCVINYSLPQTPETYIHRIGRTGRAGKKGMAITFATPGESRRLELIRKGAHAEIPKRPLPSGEDIVEAKKQRFTTILAEVAESGKYEEYLNFAEELLTMTDSPADLLAAVLRFQFKEELLPASYPEIGAKKRDRNKSWAESEDIPGMARVFIGVGKNDGFGAVKILDLLWEKSHIKKSRVGRIDCFDKFSFLNLEPEDADHLIAACRQHGPRVQYAADAPEKDARAERKQDRKSADAPMLRESLKAKKVKRTPPERKKKLLKDWVDRLCADVEASDKRKHREKRPKDHSVEF